MTAIILGFKDGYEQPYEFSTGMTYDNDTKQWLYDQASIIGQRIARLRDAWAQPE